MASDKKRETCRLRLAGVSECPKTEFSERVILILRGYYQKVETETRHSLFKFRSPTARERERSVPQPERKRKSHLLGVGVFVKLQTGVDSCCLLFVFVLLLPSYLLNHFIFVPSLFDMAATIVAMEVCTLFFILFKAFFRHLTY